MYHCRPTRTYTKQAIFAWMDKLSKFCRWDDMFSEDVLELGEKFFDENVLRNIEILDDCISLVAEIDEQRYYCIIDWEESASKPTFKYSGDNHDAHQAIVVAGLLNIEELIADQVDAMVPDFVPAENRQKDIDLDAKNLIAERLLVKFFMSNQMLCMVPCWASGESIVDIIEDQQKCAALKNEAKRGAVVRMIYYLNRSVFKFDKKNRLYAIDDLQSACDFCRHSMSSWREYFTISAEKSANLLIAGIRDIDLRADVVEHSEKEIRVTLKTSNENISSEMLSQMLQHDGKAFFVENYGVVRLDKTSANDIREIFHKIDADASAVLPKYMFFSLFSAAKLKVDSHIDLLNNSSANELELPTFLKDYQADGVRWMRNVLRAGCHCLLADEMGLGKSVQILSLIFSDATRGESLIVCPASVISVWESEVQKFFPDKNVEVLGKDTDLNRKVDILVASYSQVRRLRKQLEEKKFSYVVLDEAQWIKNCKSKTAHACCSINAEFRLAVTGTPIENNLSDIWSIFKFLMPGLLCERKFFLDNLADVHFRTKIKQQLSPFVLRRTKDSVALQLPEKQEIDLMCSLSDVQRKIYSELKQNASQYLKSLSPDSVKKNRFNMLAILTRMRQAACHPHLVNGNDYEDQFVVCPKLELLFIKLEEIFASGKKVIIFSQFLWFLDEIERNISEKFGDVKVNKLTGASVNRANIINSFQKHDGAAAILVSLKAGGVGLTLHSAEYVFLMEPWWNPAVEQQAIARAHRIGQKKNVTVYRMITRASIEEHMRALQIKKLNLFDEFVASEKISQSLTNFYLENMADLIK